MGSAEDYRAKHSLGAVYYSYCISTTCQGTSHKYAYSSTTAWYIAHSWPRMMLQCCNKIRLCTSRWATTWGMTFNLSKCYVMNIDPRKTSTRQGGYRLLRHTWRRTHSVNSVKLERYSTRTAAYQNSFFPLYGRLIPGQPTVQLTDTRVGHCTADWYQGRPLYSWLIPGSPHQTSTLWWNTCWSNSTKSHTLGS